MANVKLDVTGNRKKYKNFSSHNYSNDNAVSKLGEYILDSDKTLSNQISYLGTPETLEGTVSAFKYTAHYFGKCSKGARKADHIIISPNKDENLTPQELLDVSKGFVTHFFPHHQAIIAVHEDTKNIHSHIMLNHINYKTGKCAHHSREDTKAYRTYVNNSIKQINVPKK